MGAFSKDEKANNKIPKAKYIFSENKYLEELVLQIRQGGKAKDKFRQIFEVNALLLIQNRLDRIVSKQHHAEGTVPIQYWAANSQRMAELMTEKLLKGIERGNFDFVDDAGNILRSEDGGPKIENLGGALWGKMKFILRDLIKGVINPYRADFDKDIPHERKLIEFLESAIEAENDPLLSHKLANIKSEQKKKLKKIEQTNQFVQWLKEQAITNTDSPLVIALKKETDSEKKKKTIMECFKELTPTQKRYSAFFALSFANKDIADIFAVTPSAVTLSMQKAWSKFEKCLELKGVESLSEISGE